ncbi:MAG: Sir2 silent information regulator family NAD-dependent deacetylase [Lachnospiraceae bacterium]
MKKIGKGNLDLAHFLYGVPDGDYIFQNRPYKEQIECAVNFIKKSEIILIGAGAGASAAAGLTYSGKRFTDNFGSFIEKYGTTYMPDMYSAGFYSFPSQEAKWGYWSKHSMINRFLPPALPLYKQLYELVKDKDYFVLTTNVDHQFQKAGFDSNRIFATQGDYGAIQCERGCHQRIYDAETLFRKMDRERKDCLIPSYMVPKCPVCGGNMAMHLRCDRYFVEDESWHEAADRYAGFLKNIGRKKGVLLELGVGFNTPMIIRFPFEKMVRENSNLSLIRLNLNEAVIPESFGSRAIGINEDMTKVLSDICHELEKRREVPNESK